MPRPLTDAQFRALSATVGHPIEFWEPGVFALTDDRMRLHVGSVAALLRRQLLEQTGDEVIITDAGREELSRRRPPAGTSIHFAVAGFLFSATTDGWVDEKAAALFRRVLKDGVRIAGLHSYATVAGLHRSVVLGVQTDIAEVLLDAAMTTSGGVPRDATGSLAAWAVAPAGIEFPDAGPMDTPTTDES